MISIPNYLDKLDNNVAICNVSDILKECHNKHGLNQKAAAKILRVSSNCYSYSLNNKSCRISFLRKFRDKFDQNLFSKIYEKENIVCTARSKIVKLPKFIDANLAYYFGYLQGDGCLTSDKKGLSFVDEYLEQINKIGLLSDSMFGFQGKTYEKKTKISVKPYYEIQIKSVVLNSFFYNVFGINRGKKNNLKIPGLIRQDKDLCRYYLAGLFDADGTLPKTPEKAKMLFIDLTMKDREFIQSIRQLISEFGIETLKIYERNSTTPICSGISKTYEIRIRRKLQLHKFLQEIGFRHPNKAIRAQKMLDLLSKGPVAQPG